MLANKQQNLWDDQIRAMADNGGVIGVHFCSRLVLGVNDRQAEIPDVIRQIKYLVDVGGIEQRDQRIADRRAELDARRESVIGRVDAELERLKAMQEG